MIDRSTAPEGAAAVDELAARLGPLARRHVALGPLTTYGVGGPAALVATVPEEAALGDVAAALGAVGAAVPVLVVGLGSNLLVADDGFPGLVVVLDAGLSEVAVESTTVRAGARAKLPVVARQAANAGLTGFEWAAGVPGSVGGAVRMNAGVHESDMAAVLARVRIVDLRSGEDVVVTASDLDLAYRSSSVQATQAVVWAELALAPGDPDAGRAAIKEKTSWRRRHQPGGRNAGSVFTNPPEDSAGRLIEAAGLKGLRIGSAEVSAKHANFIQADEGGRAADVWALMAEIRRRVRDHAGVDLHAETCVVGFDSDPEGNGGAGDSGGVAPVAPVASDGGRGSS